LDAVENKTDTASMKSSVRWGIIGLGVGQHHLAALLQDQICAQIRIWDKDPLRLEQVSRAYPAAIACHSEEEIIGAPDVQGVSICSFDDAHFRQVIDCMNAGQHIFVEKPICLRCEELIVIRKMFSQRRQVRLSMNMVLRTNGRFSEIRRNIRNGELGEVFSIEADYLWGRVEKLSGWRSQVDGYSLVLGAGIHVVDLLLWLTGELPVEVKAMGNDIGNDGNGSDCASFVCALLRFPSGLVGKVTANGRAVHPHFHSLRVFGTKKTAWHSMSESVWISSKNYAAQTKAIDGDYPDHANKKYVIQSFLSDLTGDNKAVVSENDIFETMSVCFAIDKALETGGTVSVEYY
jgi:predicted dehydrogenase